MKAFLLSLFALSNLAEYDKTTSLQQLTQATNTELWDIFLSIQVDLFFDQEANWIQQQPCWAPAQQVLEIGSGNGAYLSKLAHRFPQKVFHGVQKLPAFVKQSNDTLATPTLTFEEADAEVFHPEWTHSADIVLFRLTLQHLSRSHHRP